MLPAAGATPAALMSYGLSKLMSKKPETFGKGNIEGVAAPETANNAASTGSLLPCWRFSLNVGVSKLVSTENGVFSRWIAFTCSKP